VDTGGDEAATVKRSSIGIPTILDVQEVKADQARIAEHCGGLEMLRRRDEIAIDHPIRDTLTGCNSVVTAKLPFF
jgi:hypothetical protein